MQVSPTSFSWRPPLPSRRSVRCPALLENRQERVTVVGGGIGGLATALALSRRDIPVTVLERSPALREEGTALGLLSNGWKALDALGVGDADKIAPVSRVQFFAADGTSLGGFVLTDIQSDAEMRGVLRRALLQKLADALPADSIQFYSDVAAVDLNQSERPVVQLADGRAWPCRLVIGADGVGSRVAASLGLASAEYSGNCAVRGVSQFEALPIPPQTIQYFMGRGTRAGTYQVEHDKVYWFVAFNAPESLRMEGPEAVVQETQRQCAEFVGPFATLLENLIPESLSFAKLSDRVNSPFRRAGEGSVALVGDAFHPTTPNLGQGGALALEDAVVLARRLASVGGLAATDAEISGALRDYERERYQRVTSVTLRSRAIGNVLSIPYAPVVSTRNALFKALNLGGVLGEIFSSTTRYDCGAL